MAQTFIGRLIMAYTDKAGPGAKKTARDVNAAMRSIERSGQRLARAPWGVGFQKNLDKLGLSPTEINQLRGSWDRLNTHIKTNNLNKALARSEISGWKSATISHLAGVHAQMRKNEDQARRYHRAMKSALRPAYMAAGSYGGSMLLGMGLREAFTAGSERKRETFRQDMTTISRGDQAKIDSASTDLSQRYKSLSKTDLMEMARVSRNLMGDTERGLGVLERMSQALVTLQSTKGGEAAVRELGGLLRGLDNIGLNKEGQKGIDQVNDMIEAMVRASQIEGQDFDASTFFNFARRSKVAGPALSPEFLSIAPAIMQDMGPDGAGNALSMAFKAFVLEAVGSAGGKKYLKERDRLGLRDKNGVVDSALFGRNPIEWTRKYLVPALIKDGVDMSDDTAIAKAVGQLSGNTNATGMLTRFITQQEQIDRLIRQYNESMGTAAAERAGLEDPFVAYRGFIESLRDLSAAALPMDSIASGLDTMSGSIKRFANSLENDPQMKSMLALGAGGGALVAGGFVAKSIYGLITAGTNLNVAAVALQRAAAMQTGGGVGDWGRKGGAGKGKLGTLGSVGFLGKALGITSALGLLTQGLGDTPGGTFEEQVANQKKYKDGLRRLFGMKSSEEVDARSRLKALRNDPSLPHNRGGSFGNVDSESNAAGAKLKQALSVSGKPSIDMSGVDASIAATGQKLRELLSLFNQVGGAAGAANNRADRDLARTYSDGGGAW